MLDTVDPQGYHVIEPCDDRVEWNAFIERNDGPAFAHAGWTEAVKSYGHDSWLLAARDTSTDAITGVLPLYHVESRLFGSQLLSPAFAERASIVLDEGERSEEARQLLLTQTKQIAEHRNVDFVSLRGSTVPGEEDFAVKNRYVTFRVPVSQGRDAMWSNIKDSRQRQVDQAAENESLRFRVGSSLDDLKAYYELYLRTMRGHGSPPHSFEFFRILWDRLRDDGNLRLSMITHEGSLINGMIDLAMGSAVYQWGVVSDYEYRDLNGGSLLLWRSLSWAAENGYESYEFGRTREGSGVYMFKKSFGGSKLWYDDLHYFPNRTAELPDPDDEKFELAKQAWQRLPLPVTRVVGPHIRKRIGI